MRKKVLLSVVLFSMVAHLLKANSVAPYFGSDAVVNTLSSVGGNSVTSPSTFTLPTGDCTLEMQGTKDTPISVMCEGSKAITYTPTATGVIRFVQRSGYVYVYEGNNYMGIVEGSEISVGFPEIPVSDIATSSLQLLQNPSFETLGAEIAASKFNLGTPWESNVTFAEWGIRVNTTDAAENGSQILVWRGSGNSNYIAQPVALKPNTTYQVTIRQVASGNAKADFNVGFGSAANMLDYATTTVELGASAQLLTAVATITTPATVEANSYFTFSNTAANTASAGNDPVTQIDYISIVEGPPAVQGITGASEAIFVDGTAYAPENVNAEAFDMTHLVMNNTFENSREGWESTTGAQNNGTASNKADAITGKYYENWNGSPCTSGQMFQTITNLPEGQYEVKMAAFGDQVAATGAGLYVFANKEVTSVVGATPAFYTVITNVVAGQNLEIGLRVTEENVSKWIGIDNVTLHYLGTIDNSEVLAQLQAKIAEVTTLVVEGSAGEAAIEAVIATAQGVHDNAAATAANLLEQVELLEAAAVAYQDATLSNLTANGATIAGFAPTTYNYSYVVAAGEAVPTLEASIADAGYGATVEVTSPQSLPGSFTVAVTAGNGSKQLYTIAYGFNMIAGWDANGAMDKTPYDAGWRTTDESVINWKVGFGGSGAEGTEDRASCQYRDNLGVGRVFIHPVNTHAFSYPMNLEQGKIYQFSCLSSQMSGSGRNTTFTVNTLADATGDTLGIDAKPVNQWNKSTKYSFSFVAPTNETLYVTWQTDDLGGTDRSLAWDFLVIESGVAYKVTFNDTKIADAYLLPGANVAQPADPVKEGHVFKGWFADDSYSTPYDFTVAPTADVTIYAKWEKDGATNVEQKAASTFVVRVQNNTIRVLGVSSYRVYNIQGVEVAHRLGDETATLPQGVYIVKANNSTQKVFVK